MSSRVSWFHPRKCLSSLAAGYTGPILTYLTRGLMSIALHNVEVTCSSKELVRFTPPPGQTCAQYAGDWVKNTSGYMMQAANETCEYCIYKTGDEYLKTLNIDYDLRWRDLGIFAAFIFSNISLVYILYWAFREFQWRKFFTKWLGLGSNSRN